MQESLDLTVISPSIQISNMTRTESIPYSEEPPVSGIHNLKIDSMNTTSETWVVIYNTINEDEFGDDDKIIAAYWYDIGNYENIYFPLELSYAIPGSIEDFFLTAILQKDDNINGTFEYSEANPLLDSFIDKNDNKTYSTFKIRVNFLYESGPGNPNVSGPSTSSALTSSTSIASMSSTSTESLTSDTKTSLRTSNRNSQQHSSGSDQRNFTTSSEANFFIFIPLLSTLCIIPIMRSLNQNHFLKSDIK